jgi:hypothetical protein
MTTQQQGSNLALRDEQQQQAARTGAQIALGQPRAYTLAELREIGQVMLDSRMFKDVNSASQAMVKILAGSELGYGPFSSMRAFHVIEGQPTPTAGEIGARIKRSGRYDFRPRFIDKDGKTITSVNAEVFGCEIIFYEIVNGKREPLGPSAFTRSDAVIAGIVNKNVWKGYFRNMAFARALTNGARWYCSDVFNGPIYTAEEMGAEVTIGPDGDVEVLGIPEAGTSEVAADPREGQRPPGKAEFEAAYAKARELKPDLPETVRAFIESNFPDFPKNDKGQVVMRSAAQAWQVWDKIEEVVKEAPPAAQEPEDGIVLEGELVEEPEAPAEAQTPEAVQTLQQISESLNLPITKEHRTHLMIMFRERKYTDENRHAFCMAHTRKKSTTEFTEADYVVVKRELEKVPIPPADPAAPAQQGELNV